MQSKIEYDNLNKTILMSLIFRLEGKRNILYFMFHELEICKDMPAISTGGFQRELIGLWWSIKDRMFGYIYFYIFINTLDQMG